MAGVVLLKDVVDAMDGLPGQTASVAYLNRKTGELYSVIDYTNYDEPAFDAEEKAKREEVAGSEDWLALPPMRDFGEYGVMEDFCESVQDERLRERLLEAIGSKGAFRRFKDAAIRAGVVDSWYAYRDERLREFVGRWLDVEGIVYEA